MVQADEDEAEEEVEWRRPPPAVVDAAKVSGTTGGATFLMVLDRRVPLRCRPPTRSLRGI